MFKKRRRWPWILGIVVLVLIGIAAIGGGEEPDGANVAAAPTTATAESAPESAPTTAAPRTAPAEPASITNARRSAESYLDFSGFSRQGLIEQLEFEGYSASDATAAIDSLDVDWNAQAARSAKSYIEMMGFSRQGLIEQLQFEGYTPDQAAHGASSVGL